MAIKDAAKQTAVGSAQASFTVDDIFILLKFGRRFMEQITEFVDSEVELAEAKN
jgi:hypothetical protein